MFDILPNIIFGSVVIPHEQRSCDNTSGYAEKNLIRNVYVVVRRVPAEYSLLKS